MGNLEGVEARLEGMFVPVTPRAEFVRDLRRRLVTQFSLRPRSDMGGQQALLIIIASALSFIMVLMVSLRTLLAVLTSLGLLYQYRHQLRQERQGRILPPLA
jgi:hypothetical protein